MHIMQTCYLNVYHIEMFHIFQFLFYKRGMLSIIVLSVVENTQDCHILQLSKMLDRGQYIFGNLLCLNPIIDRWSLTNQI